MKKVLAGKSPRERAFELVSGTKVRDVGRPQEALRGRQGGGGRGEGPDDRAGPAGRSGASRAVRKRFENEVDEPKRQAYAALAKAQFAMDGDKVYPDATFTLRLAFGTVKGYTEDGKTVPPFTDDGRAVRAERRSRGTRGRSSCRSAGWSGRTSST